MLGGDNLTFTGTNFPRGLDNNDVIVVEVGNTLKTKCKAVSSASTTMVCLTEPFDKAADLSKTYTATATINTVPVTVPVSFGMKSINKKGLTMSPSSVSPVIKTLITFSLETDFPHALKPEDISLNISAKTDASGALKAIAIVSVDDTKKTFTCKFGGAMSGDYNVFIRHKDFGLIDASSLTLKVESQYTSITPLTGSIYGGTLLTIKGKNFGTVYTDNPVEIFKLGEKNVKCPVLTTKADEITCRIEAQAATGLANGYKGKVIVFLKTAEESNCTASACDFVFTDTLPEVTAVAKLYDAATNKWQIAIDGTNFAGTKDTTEFYVGGAKQVVSSITA